MKKYQMIFTGVAVFLLIGVLVVISVFEDARSKPWLLTEKALEDENYFYCLIQKQELDKAKCLDKYAYYYNTTDPCMKIEDLKRRDNCLTGVLFASRDVDFDCSLITNNYTSKACEVGIEYNMFRYWRESKMEPPSLNFSI